MQIFHFNNLLSHQTDNHETTFRGLRKTWNLNYRVIWTVNSITVPRPSCLSITQEPKVTILLSLGSLLTQLTQSMHQYTTIQHYNINSLQHYITTFRGEPNTITNAICDYNQVGLPTVSRDLNSRVE